jgi:tetratricopeptide (TPR) repeat protein
MFVPRRVVAALGVGAMQAQSPHESAVDGGDTTTTGVAKGRVVVIVLTAVAALVLVLVAMLYWRYQQHAEVEELVVQARVALDTGDLQTASARLAEVAVRELDRDDVRWLQGRVAQAGGDDLLAVQLLEATWQRALEDGWEKAEIAEVGLQLADALSATDATDQALAINDRALAEATLEIDQHLDREDLGADGRPRLQGKQGGEKIAAVAHHGLALLEQRGRLAAHRVVNLLAQGDDKTLKQVLKEAEDRISSSVCTGTHRVYCRGVRASVRDGAMGPIERVRIRVHIKGALALVKERRYEDALELARQVGEDLQQDKKSDTTDPSALRDAARVEYAVRLEWAKALEKDKRWKDAHEQYNKAAALHAKTGMKLAEHAVGLQRSRAVSEMLDETSSVLDHLSKIGIGSDERARFHKRIEADPVNPRVYTEEAISEARRAHLSFDAQANEKRFDRVQRYLEVGRRVAPTDRLTTFYSGVTRYLAGYPKQGIEAMRKAYQAGYKDRAAELYLGQALGLRGDHEAASRHWLRAWQLRKTDTYVGRRAVEALVAAGHLEQAKRVLAGLVEERVLDANIIEAQVMVHFHGRDNDALRKVLATDRWRFSSDTPEPVRRAHRIAESVYNKLGERVAKEVLRPGEELIDRIYGYAVEADAEGMVSGKRVQSAMLVLTTQRAVLLRWDASRDYKDEIQKGAVLMKRAASLGLKLGGEWSGLSFDSGIGRLVQALDLMPRGSSGAKGKSSTFDESVAMVIESLELFDLLHNDLELRVDPADIHVQVIAAKSVVAYDLVAVRPNDGLYALHGRLRDGRSPWQTDGDRLMIYTTRPGRVRMYMDRYLLAR